MNSDYLYNDVFWKELTSLEDNIPNESEDYKLVLLNPSCAALGWIGPTGSIQFSFKLEVESVQFDFKNSSRDLVWLGFDEVSKADGADGVNGVNGAGPWGR